MQTTFQWPGVFWIFIEESILLDKYFSREIGVSTSRSTFRDASQMNVQLLFRGARFRRQIGKNERSELFGSNRFVRSKLIRRVFATHGFSNSLEKNRIFRPPGRRQSGYLCTPFSANRKTRFTAVIRRHRRKGRTDGRSRFTGIVGTIQNEDENDRTHL